MQGANDLTDPLASVDRFPLRAIMPGLIMIALVDGMTVVGLWPSGGWINHALPLILVSVPWATAFILRLPVRSFGYHRRQFLRVLGWGIVAGGYWRLASLLFNLWMLKPGPSLPGFVPPVISALIWIPLVEETFFRGYLGRALSGSIGVWPGIILQAILFTFQPVHWGQGGVALVSILVFGVLAGWLQERWDSIWPAWGAHAFANLLPLFFVFA